MTPRHTAPWRIVRHGHEGGDIEGWHEQLVWLGAVVWRDRAGRRHEFPTTRFAQIVCNNPGCLYEALINVEAVAEGIELTMDTTSE